MERTARRRIEHAERCGLRFDALWSHWLFPSGVLGARLARAHGLPHVVTAHGADVHRLERLTRIPVAREACTRIWSRTRITAPAELTARRVSRALAGRTVEVCPLPAFTGATAGDEKDPHRAPRLLYLGRFEPIKGPDRLLDACERVPRGAIERVTLAGAGSLEPSLRARAAALAHPVDFTGVLEGEAKRAAVTRADFMVLPSRRLEDGRTEGFPHAAMEALAAGTPVIAPRGGALGEWIDRTGAGATFEDADRDPECADRLGQLIESLALSPERRADLAARVRRAGTVFAPANAMASWCRVLADAKPAAS
jgi:glycosyltransferase involved in cell wall biosynthesis